MEILLGDRITPRVLQVVGDPKFATEESTNELLLKVAKTIGHRPTEDLNTVGVAKTQIVEAITERLGGLLISPEEECVLMAACSDMLTPGKVAALAGSDRDQAGEVLAKIIGHRVSDRHKRMVPYAYLLKQYISGDALELEFWRPSQLVALAKYLASTRDPFEPVLTKDFARKAGISRKIASIIINKVLGTTSGAGSPPSTILLKNFRSAVLHKSLSSFGPLGEGWINSVSADMLIAVRLFDRADLLIEKLAQMIGITSSS